jgi:rod shape determining protein RodA
MIDRQHIKNIDWTLIGLLMLNMAIGVAFVYSSSSHVNSGFYLRQLFWVAVSLVALFLLLGIDYRFLAAYSIYGYILLCLLLLVILAFGSLTAGTKSWIKMPFFQIQPSEFMKIVMILLLSWIFSKFNPKKMTWFMGLLSGSIVSIPFLLVALQPDLGTALGYIAIILAAFILTGIDKRAVIFLLICSVVLSLVVWNFGLHDYQKRRLTTVLFPESDPLGSGYQIIQSKIAIGSGGLTGKGFAKGTQSQLRFLPARHTDFIFSVIAEELGFLGAVFSVVVYFLFIARLFHAVTLSRDRMGAYIAFLVAVMISVQFFINVFMTIGLFPIAGIPLPFLSYGGSSMLANSLAVSLVINVKMRRFVNI